MREGDRIVVDVSRRLPSTGETFVLWDGHGLVVKQVERVQGPWGGRERTVPAQAALRQSGLRPLLIPTDFRDLDTEDSLPLPPNSETR